DINVAMPVFKDGVIVGFSATVAHAPDIGGRLRSPGNRDLFEEGLRIPPTMLVHAGETNKTLVNIIRDNVRVPDQVMGDLWAQVAANRMLGHRVIELIDDAACDLFVVGSEMHERSEAAMRKAIKELPTGTYSY